jgi:AraC-like DNA-binding protein
MPESLVRTFSDPDQYANSLGVAQLQLTVTGRGTFIGKSVYVRFDDLWIHRFSESLPLIAHLAIIPGRAVVSFWTRPGLGLLWNGQDVQASKIIRHCEAEESYRRSAGASSRAVMSLPIEKMASVGAALSGYDLTSPGSPLILTPPLAAMRALQSLHASVADLAQRSPAILAVPAVARAIEQSLIAAMMDCLSTSAMDEDRMANRHHHAIMRRFHENLEQSPNDALFLPEVCAAIGVPGRTLRACCQEYLGMGPKRYLTLRRLHLARQALREMSPGSGNVTDVATQYGFWQFGRFSGHYKTLFGELPSVTLRRPPEKSTERSRAGAFAAIK